MTLCSYVVGVAIYAAYILNSSINGYVYMYMNRSIRLEVELRLRAVFSNVAFFKIGRMFGCVEKAQPSSIEPVPAPTHGTSGTNERKEAWK